ncbi:MAG TPA: ATPase, T2SS/T4P/T4SS family, partial [Gemmatimonadales bacterium]
MPARLDPFIDLLLKNAGEQLTLIPDEPVGLEKDGRSTKLSKQALSERQMYALLTEIAPSECADLINQGVPTSFAYAADRGLVQVKVTPDNGRLVAAIMPDAARPEPAPPAAPAPAAPRRPSGVGPSPIADARKPRLSVVVTPPPVDPTTTAPAALPGEFADGRLQTAQRELGRLLKSLVETQSSDLHLRVEEPPVFRTHGEIQRQEGAPLSGEQLDLLLLSIMPERNRVEWRESGDTDFAYEIAGLARFRVNAARDRKGSVGVFRVIPAKVVTVEEMQVTPEVQKLCYLTKGLVLVTGPTGSGKSTTLCALIDLVNRERTDHIITI